MSVESKIIEVFETCRQAPNSPYDSARFLDFLVKNPKSNKSIKDSFLGVRKYNAFMNAAQLEFGICFSNEDYDKAWSLEKFSERVEEKMKNPGAVRTLVKKRIGRSQKILVGNTIFISIFIAAICIYVFVPAFAVLSAFLGFSLIAVPLLIWLVLTIFVYWIHAKELGFYRALENKINAEI